ncbi:dipeptidase PepV [Bacillus sp. FJAT-45037]|uniref:dipeptidase PepV n=1 Tax=Bacillus sp. FJAT-45037 TaxID=2011007 RepID=UPI000C25120A|nr:dipeptidase PepV [Bacillus sp. FJAT-45037]
MMKIDWINEVETRKEKLIEQTQEFLRINSVLDESTATKDKPFGEGIHQALSYMLTKGKECDFSVKDVDGYAGYVEHGAGDESVGVLCHLDVVPVGANWTSPPFSAEIRGGKIFARGAIDNKGPTMAAFFALSLLSELDVPLSRRIRMIFGTDEESNWRCVEHYFKHEEMPTIGFAPDADFPIIHAEKGIMDVRLSYPIETHPDSEVELQSFVSGDRLNMVPDEAIAVIKGERSRLEGLEQHFKAAVEKEQLEGHSKWEGERVTFTLAGKSAHGSTPEKGQNAGVLLANCLTKFAFDGSGSTFLMNIASTFTNDFHGEKLGIKTFDQVSGPLTVNLGRIHYEKDKEAILGLNIRYPVTAKGQDIRKGLEVFAKAKNATLDILDHMEPSYVEKDHPLIQALQAVYERQTGEEATLLAIGGGTYARSLDVGVAFGPMFPGREDVAHQKDEYIIIEDLIRATAIYAEAMYELAK